ncbi:response regulator [uncultured Paraglaciecola sp.]|jgi:response regulator RpfG family c-di-GMP phosphodiesterase|uniref:response regulator n=1 Tax=uncultured Paraglaciecola sp. TaxID=1765024 RepID=UPI0026221FE4|nr:response regulator [uncultured Paraglaciecola sp.]
MNKPIVLFVDDETSVLRALNRLFRKENVTIMTAPSAAEGLKLLDQHSISVVVTDQRMTEMCGTDFLKNVRASYPDTVRCILSGYAEMDSVIAAINDGNVYRFIYKPWDDTEIIGAVNECLTVAMSKAKERSDRASLENRATVLEEESVKFAELIELQQTLLNSSRKPTIRKANLTYRNRRPHTYINRYITQQK